MRPHRIVTVLASSLSAAWKIGVLPVAIAVAVVGCGGSSVPARELAQTEAAVRAAEDVGAAEIPRASAHLEMAREQLALAQRYIDEGEGALAEAALERAAFDAEVALGLAREAQTRSAADDAQKRVVKLRAEVEGGADVASPEGAAPESAQPEAQP